MDAHRENLDSKRAIRDLMAERGLATKKRFGQNFLVNPGAKKTLVNHAEIKARDTVWEIGPGLGALTELLLERGACVHAFEIDHGFASYLSQRFADEPSITIIEGDFLSTYPAVLGEYGPPDVIFGNLPYSTAAVMIAELVIERVRPGRLVFIVQREVADRIVATPGTRGVSSFSYLCQSAFDVSSLGDLKAGSFYPEPNVVSRMVLLTPHNRHAVSDYHIFDVVMRTLFSGRRKTLRNSASRIPAALGLQTADTDRILLESGIDPTARVESLSIDKIVALTNAFSRLTG